MILARFTTITGTCNLLQHSVPLERQLEFMTLKMGKWSFVTVGTWQSNILKMSSNSVFWERVIWSSRPYHYWFCLWKVSFDQTLTRKHLLNHKIGALKYVVSFFISHSVWKSQKSLIQHCERSELRLYFTWTEFIKNAKNGWFWWVFEKCDFFEEFSSNVHQSM